MPKKITKKPARGASVKAARAAKPAGKPPRNAGPKPATRKPKLDKPVADSAVKARKPKGISPQLAAQQARARQFAIEAARCLSDDKCSDVLVLDVRNKSQLSDYILLASGTSDRQMRSAAEHVKDLAQGSGHQVFRTNLDDQTTWIVLDCSDVVAHVFEPNARAFYDLESLWGDAPQVDWAR